MTLLQAQVTRKAVNTLFPTFHISTFRQFVHPNSSMTTLIAICIGNIRNAYCHCQASPSAGAHPISIYFNVLSDPSTIVVKAAPTVSPIYPISRLIPINATPKVNADENALPGFIPTMIPIMNNTIGKNTAAPKSSRPWNTEANISIIFFSSSFLLL